jgi:hypothetical protein
MHDPTYQPLRIPIAVSTRHATQPTPQMPNSDLSTDAKAEVERLDDIVIHTSSSDVCVTEKMLRKLMKHVEETETGGDNLSDI